MNKPTEIKGNPGKSKVRVCAHCGEQWIHAGAGRPPKTCSQECKSAYASNRQRRYYLANQERITARNKAYRDDRKEELAASARDKRKHVKEENPDVYRDRYWKNIDREKAKNRLNYEKHKEKRNQESRAYYKENRAKIIDSVRKYRKENLEEINARRRSNYSSNADKYRSQCADRRALIAGSFVESVSLDSLLERENYLCGICGGKIPVNIQYGHPLYPHIDHILPLSRGGEHSYSNTQPAHASCNVQKGDKVDGWHEIKPIF